MQRDTGWLKVSPRGHILEVTPFGGTFKVSSKTVVGRLAGSIHDYLINTAPSVDALAIGAGAGNQVTKAIATAAGWLEKSGHEAACKVRFDKVCIDGKKRTAMRWTIFLM